MIDLPAGCIEAAYSAYHVPKQVIERVVKNAGHGFGPMGISPEWMPYLKSAGFNPASVRSDKCTNILAGAWIIAHSVSAVVYRRSVPREVSRTASAVSGSPDVCVRGASKVYHLPEQLLRAIIATEGGRVGQVVKNANGSFDMGPAQINSAHLKELSHFGISKEALINDGCLNIRVGAWILARCLQGLNPFDDPAEFWKRVGNYNSANPRFNQRYQALVWKNLTKRVSSR